MTFTTPFGPNVYAGFSITARATLGGFITGLELRATIHRDDTRDSPEERDCGFWPSLDPKSPGYIGPKSESTLRRHMKQAESILEAWRNDEWFYCGVAVQAFFDDEPLTEEFEHALWGIDCNYPAKGKRPPNSYLLEVANELAGECARQAIGHLTELVEIGLEHRKESD